jgi:hypothetical protein
VDLVAAITLLVLVGLVALAAGVESRAAFTSDETWEHHL